MATAPPAPVVPVPGLAEEVEAETTAAPRPDRAAPPEPVVERVGHQVVAADAQRLPPAPRVPPPREGDGQPAVPVRAALLVVEPAPPPLSPTPPAPAAPGVAATVPAMPPAPVAPLARPPDPRPAPPRDQRRAVQVRAL